MNSKTISGMNCVLALFVLLVIALPAQAASFDCAKAGNEIEKVICGNNEISKLDERLSASYKKALAGAPDPAQFKMEQQAWLKIRNDACYILMGMSRLLSTYADEDCLIDLYKDRTQTLEYEASRSISERKKMWASEAPLSMVALPGERFQISPMQESNHNLGHGYAICEAMVRWANQNTDEMTCPADVAHTLPGIEEVEWQQLDPKEHEELIYKFSLLAAVDSLAIKEPSISRRIYFGDHKSDKWPDSHLQQKLRDKVKADIASGIKMWSYRGVLFFWGQGGGREVTVIRLEHTDAHCTKNASKATIGSIAFVTNDLKELDRSVYSDRSFVIDGRMLKRFKGQTFFIKASEEPYFANFEIEHEYGADICEIGDKSIYRRRK